MAGNNAIHILRGSREKIATSEKKLEAGQPLYNTTDNYLYVGYENKNDDPSATEPNYPQIKQLDPIACREMKGYAAEVVSDDIDANNNIPRWSINYVTGEGIKFNNDVVVDSNGNSNLIQGAVATGVQAVAFGGKTYGKFNKTAQTCASGNQSFAVGGSTQAMNDYSFASGCETIAEGRASVACGEGSEAVGSYSFASGYYTTAEGAYSTTFGKNTVAQQGGFASGEYAKASGAASFACGYGTQANAPTAQGIGSFAGGSGDVRAEGAYSFAYGRGDGNPVLSSGPHSLAIGYNVKSYGTFSKSIGDQIQNWGSNTVCIGSALTCGESYNDHEYSTSLGYSNTNYSSYTCQLGTNLYTGSNKDYSTLVGYKLVAGGEKQTVLGQFNTYTDVTDASILIGNGTGGGIESRHNAIVITPIKATSLSEDKLTINTYTTEIDSQELINNCDINNYGSIYVNDPETKKNTVFIGSKDGYVTANKFKVVDTDATETVGSITKENGKITLDCGLSVTKSESTFAGNIGVKQYIVEDDNTNTSTKFYYLHLGGDKYLETNANRFGLDADNGDIIRLNSIYFADKSDSNGEGFHFAADVDLTPERLIAANSAGTDTSKQLKWHTLKVDGNGKFMFIPNRVQGNAGDAKFTVDSSGNVVASLSVTADSFYANSDRRLKENIQPYTCSKSILDLPVYEFDYINSGEHTIGCMAQDLQDICPQLVTEKQDGYLTINESKLVYLLLQEVKELKNQISQLEDMKRVMVNGSKS